MTSQNVWNMSLFERFFKVLSLVRKPGLDPHQSQRSDPDTHQSNKLDLCSYPHQSLKLDPDPHRIRIYVQMTSQNVWNMSLYLEARIRISIKVKGQMRIRIRIKVRSRIRIRIRIDIKVTIRIRDTGGVRYVLRGGSCIGCCFIIVPVLMNECFSCRKRDSLTQDSPKISPTAAFTGSRNPAAR